MRLHLIYFLQLDWIATSILSSYSTHHYHFGLSRLYLKQYKCLCVYIGLFPVTILTLYCYQIWTYFYEEKINFTGKSTWIMLLANFLPAYLIRLKSPLIRVCSFSSKTKYFSSFTDIRRINVTFQNPPWIDPLRRESWIVHHSSL